VSGSADSQTHHTQPQATTHHELLTPTYYCVYVYNIYILYISIYRVIKEVGGRRSFGFLGSGRRSERGRVFDGLRPPIKSRRSKKHGVWCLLPLGRKLVEGRAGPRHARRHTPS
jgi:hypothetical protein